eukprot:TRINITY_DN27060_c0_g1_i2.p1 TRINITY_DN27060_c0_g1~~TRINITY_DN27060_c0_g1_i2.p1  ORF type:complete len:407 (-),score=24.48 TRINITY_DN27060_c0_g1_i2:169-1308(-)
MAANRTAHYIPRLGARYACTEAFPETIVLADQEVITQPTLSGFCFAQGDHDLSAMIDTAQKVVGLFISVLYNFSIGLRFELSEFDIRRHPRPPLTAVFSQVFVNPVILLLLLSCFDLEEHTIFGFVLIAVSPGGSLSNLYSDVSRGSIEISALCTCTTTTLALGTYPLGLKICEQLFQWGNIKVPMTSILVSIALVLVPIAVSLCVRYLFNLSPTDAAVIRLGRIAKAVSIALFAVSVILLFCSPLDRTYIVQLFQPQIVGCSLVFATASFIVGYAISVAARLPTKFHRTIGFEVGVQNLMCVINIISLTFAYTERAAYLTSCLVYMLSCFFVHIPIVLFFRYCVEAPWEALEPGVISGNEQRDTMPEGPGELDKTTSV